MAHAKRCGNALRQTFAKEGKALKRKAGGYAHAKQFNRLTRTVKRQRTMALALALALAVGHPVPERLSRHASPGAERAGRLALGRRLA